MDALLVKIAHGQNVVKMKSNKRKTTEQFIFEAKKIHGEKYAYDKVEYINCRKPVTIICKKHGDFKQAPIKHVPSKQGCPLCAGNTIGGLLGFIERAKEIHGDVYDYSLVEYKNKSTPIKIICKKHGEFNSIPHNHIWQKSGCPQCSKGRKSAIETEWLDSLGIPTLERQKSFKINGKNYIFDGYDRETNTVYEFHGDFYHGNPKYFYGRDIHPKCGKTFGELLKKTINRKRELEKYGFRVVEMWESKWLELNNKKYNQKEIPSDNDLGKKYAFVKNWQIADDEFFDFINYENLFLNIY